jgi:recombination protein U
MKYPDGTANKSNTYINYSNRGMTLEDDINKTNEYYLTINKAIIHKKPTPIQVTKVDYSRNGTIIKEAYFKIPSTTDYNGLYKGKYIDFEAKESKNKNSFPLANIHPHQINHIRSIIEHNGIVFLIVRFTTLNVNYLIKGEDFISFVDNNQRSSIPISFFKEKAYEMEMNYNPRLDYLKIIDVIYFGGDLSEKDKKIY